MKAIRRIRNKGQVTIPKEIRDSLNLTDGDYVEITCKRIEPNGEN